MCASAVVLQRSVDGQLTSEGKLSACEQMRVSQAAPQRAPPPGDPLGHLDTGALGRLLAANQAHVQQQASVLHCAIVLRSRRGLQQSGLSSISCWGQGLAQQLIYRKP